MSTNLPAPSGSIDIYDLFRTMEEDQIILSFKGEITQDLLGSVYQIMESRLQSTTDEPKRRKKFYNILVECLQNVYHHMVSMKEDTAGLKDRDAIFMIGHGGDGSYRIITGNFIQRSNVDDLRARIDHINALDPDALRQYYLEKLNNSELSEKGTAGLGFIDMARKSGHRLDYTFHEVSEQFSFFSLAITVK